MGKNTMAVSSKRTMIRPIELQIPNRWRDKDTSPERTMVWTDPPPKSSSSVRLPTNHVAALMTPTRTTTTTSSSDMKVPVVYYLCRNGQLEHPHFVEVHLSSHDGLFLSDVIDRLNLLRGRGMASMYSWSCKRSYKNGFVWHDLTENDFIDPSHGNEYVLKGSELLENPVPQRPLESVSFRSPKPPETLKSGGEESDFSVVVRRRNQSWSSFDLGEYKVYKTDSSSELNPKASSDAATQTDEKRRRRRLVTERREKVDEIQKLEEKEGWGLEQNTPSKKTAKPGRDLATAVRFKPGDLGNPDEGRQAPNARTCQGSWGGEFDKRAGWKSEGLLCPDADVILWLALVQGLWGGLHKGPGSVAGQSKQGQASDRLNRTGQLSGTPRGATKLEEYFGGSLIETKKEELPSLKRSNSYNADR